MSWEHVQNFEDRVSRVNSKKKLKVMFVHEVSYEAKVVYEIHEFPEFLAIRGHDIVFVDFPEHQVSVKSLLNRPRSLNGRAVPNSQIRLYSLANLLPTILGRLMAVLIAWFQIPQIIKKEEPDVVILYGVPTNGVQTIWAAHRRGIPVIHRAIDVSHLLREGILSKFIVSFEKKVFERSDLIIANNIALAKYIASFSNPKREVKVLSPGIQDMTMMGAELSQEEKFDFVFMGTLFRFSGLDWFIQEMSKKTNGLHTTLLIIGDGEDGARLRGLVQELNLQARVQFTGFVEFAQLKSQVLRGRIGLLPFMEVPVARYALPGKVLQYLRFGIPTVSTRLEGLMSILPSGDGVVYAKPGQEFYEAAIGLLNDSSFISEIVERGNKTLDRNSDWTKNVTELEDTLYSVVLDYSIE